MKKTLLLVLLMGGIFAYAQPAIGTPDNLTVCDSDINPHDGVASFNLTVNTPVVLNGLNPAEYTVTYHTSESNAITGNNLIADTSAYHGHQHDFIWVRIAQLSNPENYATAFFELLVNMSLYISDLPLYIADNDGVADNQTEIDLTGFENQMGYFADYYPANTFFSFYTSLQDAENQINPITNPENYTVTNGQSLYCTVVDGLTGCSNISTLIITLTPPLAIGTPPDMVTCDPDGSGSALFNLTLATAGILNGLDPQLYTVTFYRGYSGSAYIDTNLIQMPDQYVTVSPYQDTVYARVTPIGATYYYVTPLHLIVNPLPPVPINTPVVVYDNDGNDDGATIFDITTLGQQIIDFNPLVGLAVAYYETTEQGQIGAEITTPQTYTAISGTIAIRIVANSTGCVTTAYIPLVVVPAGYVTPAPQGELTQTFTAGQTLASLAVNGQDIQWYATPTGGTPLSPDTPLEEGVTYYAAQTVYGIESTERLPVTAQRLLDTQNTIFKELSYYPNPVQNVLTISAATPPDAIEVYSLLGQMALRQNAAGASTALAMQSLQSGLYIVKIYTGNEVKTIKVIKE